jgi:hypothetical protein
VYGKDFLTKNVVCVSAFPHLCVSISALMCQYFHAYVSAFSRLRVSISTLIAAFPINGFIL